MTSQPANADSTAFVAVRKAADHRIAADQVAEAGDSALEQTVDREQG